MAENYFTGCYYLRIIHINMYNIILDLNLQYSIPV